MPADPDVLSTVITNAVATPRVPNNAAIAGGTMVEGIGVATTTATQADDTVIRMVRVPSNARISSVLLSAADAVTGGKVDVGVFQTAANGGAVVDRDLFGSAVDLTGGPFKDLDVTQESDEYTIAEMGKPLWEVIGLSADSQREYDICLQVETVFSGGPTVMGLKVRYVI